jgi:hypothetical protein
MVFEISLRKSDMRKSLSCLSHVFSAAVKSTNTQPAVCESLREETDSSAGVERSLQSEGR